MSSPSMVTMVGFPDGTSFSKRAGYQYSRKPRTGSSSRVSCEWLLVLALLPFDGAFATVASMPITLPLAISQGKNPHPFALPGTIERIHIGRNREGHVAPSARLSRRELLKLAGAAGT